MPLYEYTCHACGDEFEVLVRSADAPLVCPSCQSPEIERLLSLFAVNSAERSSAALTAARKRLTNSKHRHDALRHEGEQIKEHLQEDCGVDLERKPAKPAR